MPILMRATDAEIRCKRKTKICTCICQSVVCRPARTATPSWNSSSSNKMKKIETIEIHYKVVELSTLAQLVSFTWDCYSPLNTHYVNSCRGGYLFYIIILWLSVWLDGDLWVVDALFNKTACLHNRIVNKTVIIWVWRWVKHGQVHFLYNSPILHQWSRHV